MALRPQPPPVSAPGPASVGGSSPFSPGKNTASFRIFLRPSRHTGHGTRGHVLPGFARQARHSMAPRACVLAVAHPDLGLAPPRQLGRGHGWRRSGGCVPGRLPLGHQGHSKQCPRAGNTCVPSGAFSGECLLPGLAEQMALAAASDRSELSRGWGPVSTGRPPSGSSGWGGFLQLWGAAAAAQL